MSIGHPGRPGRLRRWVWNSKVIAPALALVGLLVLWEIVVRLGSVPSYLLPAPTTILAYTIDHAGVLLPYARDTTLETLLGFAISVIFGIRNRRWS